MDLKINFYKIYVKNKNLFIILIIIINETWCQRSGQDYIQYNLNHPYSQNQPNLYQPTNRNQNQNNFDPTKQGADTFFYNNRRYGFSGTGVWDAKLNQYVPVTNQFNTYQLRPDLLHPINTQYGYDENESYKKFFLPGVLNGWRTDLQGRERPDSFYLQQQRDVFVNTPSGRVQGFKVFLYDDPNPDLFKPEPLAVEKIHGVCNTFLGIPYALPPVQEGRFKPPRRHKGWQLMQAVDFGPACPQPIKYIGATKGVNNMDEDCLYLNIYTPSIESTAKKLPVLFHIHGGNFIHGASNLFPGHVLATFFNVIVVTINYRLGALGFLSTMDENSPGNYGILDQAMALQWVHENIDSFNGDRDAITVFGPDAGAASAGLLLLMPKTRNLIKGVYAQSGSAVADWAMIEDKYHAQNTSRVFGLKIGCSIESSWKLVNCLKLSRSAFEIGNAELDPHLGFFPWSPVLYQNITMPWYDGWRESDWHFLNLSPKELFIRGQFNKNIKYFTGVTTQEAAMFIRNNASLAPRYEINREFFDQKIWEHVVRYNYTLNPWGVYNAIKYMYTYWPDPNSTYYLRDSYIKYLSDYLYVSPVDKMMKLLLRNKVETYYYVLNTTVEALANEEWYKYYHNIEQIFLTGAPFMDEEFFPKKGRIERNKWTGNDRNMSYFFMKSLSDFAITGNPSFQQILGLHYEKAEIGELKYLNVNTTYNSSVLMNYRQTETAFWNDYIPTVVMYLVATYPPTTEIWYESRQPLQIAFWGVTTLCLMLVVLTVVCTMLWGNAKRSTASYYDGELFSLNSHMETLKNEQFLPTESPVYDYNQSASPPPPLVEKPRYQKTPQQSSSVSSLISQKRVQTPSPLPFKSSEFQLAEGCPQTEV